MVVVMIKDRYTRFKEFAKQEGTSHTYRWLIREFEEQDNKNEDPFMVYIQDMLNEIDIIQQINLNKLKTDMYLDAFLQGKMDMIKQIIDFFKDRDDIND